MTAGEQQPLRPSLWDGEHVRTRFSSSRVRPRRLAWFGFGSFWGHLRHFIASAIATENVDSRDWMTADEPEDLAFRIAEVLGEVGDATDGESLTSILGRDLWIDYLADTGDDGAVSRAVAELVVQEYVLPVVDGEDVHAPRGDVLLFGGDTAYPVATVREITNRVLGPFNEVLAERDDGKRRVVLGIPGNHDWYDGLDGFNRMFREGAVGRTVRSARRHAQLWRFPLREHAEWAREFLRGGQLEKPARLELVGYEPVQSASYFAFPASPGIDLVAADRQLKRIDARQANFFDGWLNDRNSRRMLILPDPVFAFGEPSTTGVQMIHDLHFDLDAEPHLVLSGDLHHYNRFETGPTTHITAGGGGAFLHNCRVGRRKKARPMTVEWPGVKQCRRLLRQIPFAVGFGTAGLIPHAVFAALYAPPIMVAGGGRGYGLAGALVVFLVVTTAYALLAKAHRGHPQAWPFAIGAALITGAVPILGLIAAWLIVGGPVVTWVRLIVLAISSFVGATILGGYLTVLTRLGFEHMQAFTALGHRGFKHFLRLRVRADGSGVDCWTIGQVDPLKPDEPVVLVDRYTFDVDEEHRSASPTDE